MDGRHLSFGPAVDPATRGGSIDEVVTSVNRPETDPGSGPGPGEPERLDAESLAPAVIRVVPRITAPNALGRNLCG